MKHKNLASASPPTTTKGDVEMCLYGTLTTDRDTPYVDVSYPPARQGKYQLFGADLCKPQFDHETKQVVLDPEVHADKKLDLVNQAAFCVGTKIVLDLYDYGGVRAWCFERDLPEEARKIRAA